MKESHKSIFNNIGASATTVVSVIAAVWYLGEPIFNDKVDKRVREFTKSPEMKVFVDGIIEREKQKAMNEQPSTVKLRKLLSDKMGIDEDEVHIEIGRMYQNENKHQTNAKDKRNKIVEEFKLYHPETKLKYE